MRSGWVGGGVTDEKGDPGKVGGQDPLTPPSGQAYALPVWLSTETQTGPVAFNSLDRKIFFINCQLSDNGI